jgi:hypothetical protein
MIVRLSSLKINSCHSRPQPKHLLLAEARGFDDKKRRSGMNHGQLNRSGSALALVTVSQNVLTLLDRYRFHEKESGAALEQTVNPITPQGAESDPPSGRISTVHLLIVPLSCDPLN